MKLAGKILILLSAIFVVSLPGKEDERHDGLIRQVMGAKSTSIVRFNPNKVPENAYFLRLDHRGSRINLDSRDREKYNQKSRNTIARVDFVTSQCANDVPEVNESVDYQRIQALADFDATLFALPKGSIGRIIQTGCQFDYQSRDWSYGLLVSMNDGEVAARSMNSERLSLASENEFSEGNVTAEAIKKDASRPQLSANFREGTATGIPFDSRKVTILGNGDARIQLGTSQIPGPVVCDGTLYLSNGFASHEVSAFDPRSLKNKWHTRLSDNGPSKAACARNVILWNTESCTLFALKKDLGTQVWSAYLGDPLPGTPSVFDNVIYTSYPTGSAAADPSHAVIALQADTGKILWQRRLSSDALQHPILNDGKLNLVTFDGILYQLGLADGRISSARRMRATGLPFFSEAGAFTLVRSDKKGAKSATERLRAYSMDFSKIMFETEEMDAPFIDRNIIEKSEFSKKARALDAANGFYGGAPFAANPESSYIHLGMRTVSAMQNFEAERVIGFGKKIIYVQSNFVTAIDRSGAKLWSVDFIVKPESGIFPLFGPIAAGEFLIIAAADGQIYQLDPENGKVLKQYDLGEAISSRPAVYHGIIFAGTRAGNIIVKKTGEESLSE